MGARCPCNSRGGCCGALPLAWKVVTRKLPEPGTHVLIVGACCRLYSLEVAYVNFLAVLIPYLNRPTAAMLHDALESRAIVALELIEELLRLRTDAHVQPTTVKRIQIQIAQHEALRTIGQMPSQENPDALATQHCAMVWISVRRQLPTELARLFIVDLIDYRVLARPDRDGATSGRRTNRARTGASGSLAVHMFTSIVDSSTGVSKRILRGRESRTVDQSASATLSEHERVPDEFVIESLPWTVAALVVGTLPSRRVLMQVIFP
jgi:hypothetical protein